MAKKTVATKVRDHRYYMPTAERYKTTDKKVATAVTLDPTNGIFSMRVPDSVIQILGCNAQVSSRDMNQLINDFDRLIEKYGYTIQSRAAKPMIIVNFRYNKPPKQAGVYGVRGLGGGSIVDDVPNLGLAMEYEVLHQIGNALYELHIDERTNEPYGDPHHRLSVPAGAGYHILEWTQEREAFLASMSGRLHDLVDGLNAFFAKDFLANLELAIAGGGGGFALPAPRHD